MLLSNRGCPVPGQGRMAGFSPEVRIEAVPVRARRIPMPIRRIG